MTGQALSEKVFILPEVLDLRAAAPLSGDLLALRGRALYLDASGVKTVGALCLQVLLSARVTWQRDDLPFSVVTPSAAFSSAMGLFGAPFLAG
ncbi:MAG TPA: STAS domain-containing protein [Rhizomicrobium sp.]|nr:STAS domain-containing protein [Rhizomicrobium sp.]